MFSDCFRLFEVVLDWSGRLGCSSCLSRFGLFKLILVVQFFLVMYSVPLSR